MPKYVAFLRAINVGGHTVKMNYLRELFESLGFSNVETYIASGNVIFDATSKSTAALEKKIEACLQETLGYQGATFIRTLSGLADIARYKPFAEAELNADGNTLYIGLMATAPADEAKEKLLRLACEADDFHLHDRELYWLRRGRFSDSKFSGALLEKTLRLQATMRNSNTVKKIVAKYS